ncbi:MAG TPA: Hsp70 family protein [Polyangia bacterium]|jgi:molecular chaperone DnaK
MSTLGIDLGTTNTAAALDGGLLSFTDGQRSQPVLPSVVAYPPTGAVLVGASARRRRAIDPKNTIFSAKRIIGRGWFARETREFQDRYPFALVRTPADLPAFQTRAGLLAPTDIAARVLAAVRAQVPVGATLSEIVVGVPSGFATEQRVATLDAVRQAGFGRARVIDEPVATAWAYLHDDRPAGRYAAVYDLGGGTFDLAVLDCADAPFRVLAHGGDLYLGGDDVDGALATWAAAEVLREHRWDLRDEPEVFDRLVVECERAKIRLSYAAQTRIELAEVDPAAPLAAGGLVLARPQLADLCTDLVRRTFGICDRVLGQAGLKARDVGAVFLAGGSCLLPMLRGAVEQYFGSPARCDFDPMEVVAIGASRAR